MLNGLMVVSKGVRGKINIGDYIQALAAKQFFPSIDIMLERETDLKSYSGNPVKMIMNGWYMNHPENWPPSDCIIPLFVAFHINICGLPSLLNQESIDYLKKHAPIGCRDTNSVQLLEKQGVNAYYTGCLTLTLGRRYKSMHRSGKTYIVEPNCAQAGLISQHKWISIKNFIYLILHFNDVKKISRKKKQHGIKSHFYNAYFLKEYSKVFDYQLLLNSEYINQYNYDIEKEYPSQEDKLNYAESLIKKYAEAECVITSRIHCALPCIGLETPVIFIESLKDDECSTSRFGGLKNLFNIIYWDGIRLKNNLTTSKINKNNFPQNKDNWKPLAQKLINTCLSFTQVK